MTCPDKKKSNAIVAREVVQAVAVPAALLGKGLILTANDAFCRLS